MRIWNSLRFKIGLFYAILALLNISFFTALIFENQIDLLVENFKFRSQSFVGEIKSKLLGLEISEADQKNIPKLKRLLNQYNISDFTLFQADGTILAESIAGQDKKRVRVQKDLLDKAYQFSSNEILNSRFLMDLNEDDFTANILVQLKKQRFLFGRMEIDSVQNRVGQIYWQMGLSVLWGVIFHILFGIFVYRVIFVRLNILEQATRKMSGGDLSARAHWKIRNEDELDRLGNAFNEMSHSIERAVTTLKRALERVRGLKHKQDADYFLTSLLIKPLAVQKHTSQNFELDFLVEQKKRFFFEKWNIEIGGDICISHSIPLRGKNYICIINCDAMGKSIQGAGGALVTGVAFNAIVNHSMNSPGDQEFFPEEWLRECYKQLHNMFLTFDGSMLITAFIGLLDDSTGCLYYLNADHPYTILYRKEQAKFIENEMHVTKIGMDGYNDSFKVNLHMLRRGDVLLTGSDGRDDLRIGTTAEGNRRINSDETRILKSIEKSKGELEGIKKDLKSRGTLTDDLSLLRISHSTPKSLPEKLNRKHADVYKKALRQGERLLRAKKYEEARFKLEEALEIFERKRALSRLIYSLNALDLHEEVLKLCMLGIEKFPTFIEFYVLGASSARSINNISLARRLTDILHYRQPENEEFLSSLIQLYETLRDEKMLKQHREKLNLLQARKESQA